MSGKIDFTNSTRKQTVNKRGYGRGKGVVMSIMLGDLSVSEIEERLGVDFPEDIREFMKQNYQPKAENIAKGKWHCFDIPFNLVCGDMETATKIYESIKGRAGECKEGLRFSLDRAG
jgi:hypothetical protein